MSTPSHTHHTEDALQRRSLHIPYLDAAHRVALFRIFFGVIWLVDAAFKWLPSFVQNIHADVMAAGQGEPSWLHWWFRTWHDIVSQSPATFGYTTAVLETLIAIGLIFGLARSSTYILGALVSVGIWSVAEGFGGPYGSGSTDIGAAVMYAVVFLALYGLDTLERRAWTLDEKIEKRVSWWTKIAEPRWAPKD
jgi:uncharacterized membrane protein YphA (DoxX/SURF4 family)